MSDHLNLSVHALAALLLAMTAVWAARVPGVRLPRWPVVAMLASGAAWALATAGLGAANPATRLLAGIEALATLLAMAMLHRRPAQQALGLVPVYGVVAAVTATSTALQLTGLSIGQATAAGEGMLIAATLLRMLVAVAALVLVNNLAMARAGAAVRLLCAAIAVLWLADLAVATTAYLSGRWSVGLGAARGVAVVVAAGLAALALRREERPVAVSRAVAYQSVSLVAIGGYLAMLAAGTSALSAFANARLYQTAFVFGVTAAVLTLVSSSWLRSWLRVTIEKHLFRHRYDYRAEWLRFTGTLGRSEDAAPLAERVVRAIADLTQSPRGLLLVPDGDGLGVGATWNWDGGGSGADPAFVRHLAGSARIVALDDLRGEGADPADLAATPQWMIDDAGVWAVVPMLHLGRLVGAVVLARPEVDRALDWEDFDLLRVAGRGVATHLAEARAQEALADTERFDEFNRRSAFIVHDIKNLVSGLSLVARNAERHADNPAFRADMVATLQDSAAKLNLLLGRLSAGVRGPADPPVAVPLLDFARTLAASRRAGHPIVVTGDPAAVAMADPARLEQIVGHLVSNAVDASPAGEAVTLAVADAGREVSIAVVDRGCGMAPAFVRDRLFRPFVSTKSGGFGIGAFEARQLAESLGGRIAVDSREGEGSTFRVILPADRSIPLEVAA